MICGQNRCILVKFGSKKDRNAPGSVLRGFLAKIWVKKRVVTFITLPGPFFHDYQAKNSSVMFVTLPETFFPRFLRQKLRVTPVTLSETVFTID